MKIKRNTGLGRIKSLFEQDFGLFITNEQAKEVRESLTDGCALWTTRDDEPYYTTTRGSDEIQSATPKGVWRTAYRTFYSTEEWNGEHECVAYAPLGAITTPAEVAEKFDVTADGVRKAASEGRIRARRSGSTFLLSLEDVKKLYELRVSENDQNA